MSNLNSTDLYERNLLKRGPKNAYVMIAGGLTMIVGSLLIFFVFIPTGTTPVFYGAFLGGFGVIAKGIVDLKDSQAALRMFNDEHTVNRIDDRSDV